MPVPITRLLVTCPDRPGIVAAVSRFLYEAGANIVRSDQYTSDPEGGTFFLRMEFALANGPARDGLAERFGLAVAQRFDMTWRLWNAGQPKRLAILVSRHDHCLLDLLWRWRRGELEAEVVMVASNHELSRDDVLGFGVPFHHVPVAPGHKPQAEARLLELVGELDVQLVVLARYMQVLSEDLCVKLAGNVINIHHSFLPSFKGAKPYHQAHSRGVKLIGATAHYVTADLDEGPIIEQEVARVNHTHSADDLAAIGRDVECQALARAVRWHTEQRVLLDGHKTIVFPR
jgi:formyltetrahydrofolate deformylase